MQFDVKKIMSLGILTNYLSFFGDFAVSPKNALRSFKKKEINASLFVFFLIGIGCSLLIARLGNALGVSVIEVTPIAFIEYFPYEEIVLISVILVFVSALMFHSMAKLWMKVNAWTPFPKWVWDTYLGGTWKDTLNGTFAFISFSAPIVTIVICITFLLMDIAVTNNKANIVLLIGGVLSMMIIIIYFNLAIAAVHPRTNSRQAFRAGVLVLLIFYGFVYAIVRLLMN